MSFNLSVEDSFSNCGLFSHSEKTDDSDETPKKKTIAELLKESPHQLKYKQRSHQDIEDAMDPHYLLHRGKDLPSDEPDKEEGKAVARFFEESPLFKLEPQNDTNNEIQYDPHYLLHRHKDSPRDETPKKSEVTFAEIVEARKHIPKSEEEWDAQPKEMKHGMTWMDELNRRRSEMWAMIHKMEEEDDDDSDKEESQSS